MIKHIVMWKLRKENSLENATKIKKDLESLKSKIKFIREIKVEISEHSGSDENGFDVILFSSFDNCSDLESYQINPEHVKVKNFIKTCAVKRAFIDYEEKSL